MDCKQSCLAFDPEGDIITLDSKPVPMPQTVCLSFKAIPKIYKILEKIVQIKAASTSAPRRAEMEEIVENCLSMGSKA